MTHLRRIRALLASRGLFGLLQAAFRRLVYHGWQSLVYRDDPAMPRLASSWPPGYRFECWERPSQLPADARAAVAAGRAGELLELLDPEDSLFIVWHGARVTSYGGIFRGSPQRYVLGLPETSILIGYCYTDPEHRGRGLFRLALNEAARQLRMWNAGPIYVEVHPENTASIKGILGADFTSIGRVDAGIWLGSFVRRDCSWHRLRRERRS